jgi:hypothetical protein
LSTVLAARSLFHYSGLASAMTPDRPGIVSLTSDLRLHLASVGITDPQAQERVLLRVLADATSQNALVLAFDDVFLLLAASSAVALLLALFLKDPVLEPRARGATSPRPARASA